MANAGELLSLYYNIGVPSHASMNVADSEYAVASKNYLTNAFADFYRDKLKGMGLGKWESTWDCDNFAWMYFTDAQWAHYQTQKSTKEGLAVGVVYYMAGARAEGGGGGGHAINTALLTIDDGYEIIFIEPQYAAAGRPSIITLTPEEIASIWLVNF